MIYPSSRSHFFVAFAQVFDQLIAESANDMTLLMYAARSGDKMTFKAVVKWLNRLMTPVQARCDLDMLSSPATILLHHDSLLRGMRASAVPLVPISNVVQYILDINSLEQSAGL